MMFDAPAWVLGGAIAYMVIAALFVVATYSEGRRLGLRTLVTMACVVWPLPTIFAIVMVAADSIDRS